MRNVASTQRWRALGDQAAACEGLGSTPSTILLSSDPEENRRGGIVAEASVGQVIALAARWSQPSPSLRHPPPPGRSLAAISPTVLLKRALNSIWKWHKANLL